MGSLERAIQLASKTWEHSLGTGKVQFQSLGYPLPPPPQPWPLLVPYNYSDSVSVSSTQVTTNPLSHPPPFVRVCLC